MNPTYHPFTTKNKRSFAGLVLLLLGVTLFLCFSSSLQAQEITKKWKAADGNLSWRFADDELGKRFIYRKGKQTIQGTWELANKNIELTYSDPNKPKPVPKLTPQQLADSLAVDSNYVAPKQPVYNPPIPLQLNIKQASADALVLQGGGKNYQLQYRDERSAIGKILDNSILRGIIGIICLLFICFLLSNNRKAINWRLVGSGILLQLLFGFLVLKNPYVSAFFQFIADFFVSVLNFSEKGARFLFGNLTSDFGIGAIFAFKILPTVVFFSALSSLLYYLGILQKVTYGIAWVMSRTMRLSGAESLAAAANVFIGQTEAPLVVKPYLDKMTKSEIMCLMTGGMATIAGGVFAAFIGFLGGDDPVQQSTFAKHLLTASIMSAPAAIVAAKMLFPETEKVEEKLEVPAESIGSNALEAISNGTTEGLKLAVNVGAMLLVFLAMVEMVNTMLLYIGQIGDLNGTIAADPNYVVGDPSDKPGLRLEYLFGYIFAPIAWILGVPSTDIVAIGQLLGQKTILNEFLAYISMGNMKATGVLTEAKSLIIATYALCGFANIGSIGIQLGGIGALAPSQKTTLAELGVKALIGGTIACFLTATIAGMLLG